MKKRTKFIIVLAIIALAAASRLVKHPFNFTPVVAMAIFAGCYLKKYWAVLLPLVAMLVSDYIIGFYDAAVMASVYVSIALAFYIGWFLQKKVKWFTVIGAALASSVVFFILTNFAVWAFFDWYAHSWQGLVSCFTLSIPFFRNTLVGDVVYTGAFFGAYELVLYFSTRRELKAEQIIEGI
jgi:hypothetical protein